MNTRKSSNNGGGGATGGASSARASSPAAAAAGTSVVAGGFAAIAQAIAAGATTPSPVVTPPSHKRKEPESGPSGSNSASSAGGTVSGGTPAPSFANGWSGNREDHPEQRVKLSPEQQCNRCKVHLDKVTKVNKRTGRLQTFGSCSSGVCGGGGVILPGDKNCVFCLRPIKANTVCLSLQTGPGEWINSHTWNCLRDTKDDSTVSAVAVVAAKKDVGEKYYDCMHKPPKNVIADKDIIITSDVKRLHFKCAVNGRKIYLASVHANQDRIFQAVAKLAKAQQEKLDNTRAAVKLSALFDSYSD